MANSKLCVCALENIKYDLLAGLSVGCWSLAGSGVPNAISL